jgi:hypothetical protein
MSDSTLGDLFLYIGIAVFILIRALATPENRTPLRLLALASFAALWPIATLLPRRFLFRYKSADTISMGQEESKESQDTKE